MSSNQTTTPTLPELHIDDGEFESNLELGHAMRAYIKRMYAGYYDIIWTEKIPAPEFCRHKITRDLYMCRGNY